MDKKYKMYVMSEKGHEVEEGLSLDEVVTKAQNKVAKDKLWLQISLPDNKMVFFKTISEFNERRDALVNAIRDSKRICMVSAILGGGDVKSLNDTVIIGGTIVDISPEEATEAIKEYLNRKEEDAYDDYPEDEGDEGCGRLDKRCHGKICHPTGEKSDIRVIIKSSDTAPIISVNKDSIVFNYAKGSSEILEAAATAILAFDRVLPEFNRDMNLVKPALKTDEPDYAEKLESGERSPQFPE